MHNPPNWELPSSWLPVCWTAKPACQKKKGVSLAMNATVRSKKKTHLQCFRIWTQQLLRLFLPLERCGLYWKFSGSCDGCMGSFGRYNKHFSAGPVDLNMVTASLRLHLCLYQMRSAAAGFGEPASFISFHPVCETLRHLAVWCDDLQLFGLKQGMYLLWWECGWGQDQRHLWLPAY